MPVGSRGVGSSLQRTSQAATECEVRIGADRVSERCLEDSLRRARPEPLGADVPKVPMDRRDEFPESVQARLGLVHHLIEDGLSELLMVRRKPMFHLDLNRGRADVPDPLEERVEVGDVEVDHFAKGSGLVLEIHLEPQMGGPQSILERAGVVGPTIDEVVMWTSRDRATSLERCHFPSRRARRIETLCSPERRSMACRKVCWSIAAYLVIKRARGGEVYLSWSWGLLRDVPGFSGSII